MRVIGTDPFAATRDGTSPSSLNDGSPMISTFEIVRISVDGFDTRIVFVATTETSAAPKSTAHDDNDALQASMAISGPVGAGGGAHAMDTTIVATLTTTTFTTTPP